MIYYERFKVVLANPFFQSYLRQAYEKGVEDLGRLNYSPEFNKKNFTCLLCGVGNEATADQFIKFVMKNNPQARFIIIDLGKEQIDAVTDLVKRKYRKVKITIKQINALNLRKIIKDGTVDWIETDGFLEFFDEPSLKKMLAVWHKILSIDGFVTTRMPVIKNKFESAIYNAATWLGKHWLDVKIYPYQKKQFDDMLTQAGFTYVNFPTQIPTLKRYSMIKSTNVHE